MTGENRGIHNHNIDFFNLMQNVGSNYGINLAEKSKLPKMDEVVTDAIDDDLLDEDRPITITDGKKRPLLYDNGCWLSAHDPNAESDT